MKTETIKKFEHVEIFSSAICNLNCSYCYIPKVPALKEINKKILDELDNGSYIEKLKRISPDLKWFGFWGAEPTITLPKITEHLDDFIREFPKLETFSFSTNLIKDPTVIYDFLSALPKDKDFEVFIQLSIDGHKPITDKNRGEGTTKKISDNIRLLAFMLNDLESEKLKVRFATKITWTMDNVRFFLDNPNELDDSYKFFVKMQNDLDRINTNRNVRYLINCWGNMEVPGEYTTEDGLDLTKLLEYAYERKGTYIYTQNSMKKQWKILPLDSYSDMLKKCLILSEDLYAVQKMFTCSAGDSQIGVAPDGYHPCHRTFSFTLNEIKPYEKCDVEFVYKNLVASNENFENDYPRLLYTLGGFHNFLKLRINATITSIYEAAKIGEILPKYMLYENAYILALINSSAYPCHIDNFILNSSVNIVPLSLIRLFGNGALDILLEEVLRKME